MQRLAWSLPGVQLASRLRDGPSSRNILEDTGRAMLSAGCSLGLGCCCCTMRPDAMSERASSSSSESSMLLLPEDELESFSSLSAACSPSSAWQLTDFRACIERNYLHDVLAPANSAIPRFQCQCHGSRKETHLVAR